MLINCIFGRAGECLSFLDKNYFQVIISPTEFIMFQINSFPCTNYYYLNIKSEKAVNII